MMIEKIIMHKWRNKRNGYRQIQIKLQKDFFDGRFIGADIKSPPFDKIAELYGAKGYKVEKISEIKHALESALNCNKPAVIDLAVDPLALYSFRRDSFKHKTKWIFRIKGTIKT